MVMDKNQAIHTLTKTIQDIEIQSEIASILDTIISDVETAHALEHQIHLERIQDDLWNRYKWAERALEEYKAMEKEKREERQRVGEAFFQDILILEEKLEAMEISANMNLAKEPEHIMTSGQEGQAESINDSSPVEMHLPLGDSVASLLHDRKVEMGVQEDAENGCDNQNAPGSFMEDGAGNVQIDSSGDALAPLEKNPHTLASSKVISKSEDKKLNLQYFKAELLMKIFEYMDALDIVNMAQANVRLYSKVNSIFGLGGTIVAGSRGLDDDDEEEEEHEDLPPVVIEHDDKESRDEQDVEILKMSTSTDKVENPSSISTTTDGHKATIVSIPPAPKVHTTSQKMIAPSDVSSAESADGSQRVSAKLWNAAEAVSKPMASTVRPSIGFQMSPSVAQSLASKLLPAELSAIIAMRDQLRKREEELQKAQAELTDLSAQLVGTVSVKDELASKVKELQKKVESDREVSAKITRQVASDQEVIAFLDERVQELEKAVDNFHMERTKANKSIDKVKDASERQVAVLNDMLTYEREQRADQEKEWKSTKKVLVKEVKLCRAQIMALEAERDGFREENQRLKEALLALGVGAKAGRSFDAIMS